MRTKTSTAIGSPLAYLLNYSKWAHNQSSSDVMQCSECRGACCLHRLIEGIHPLCAWRFQDLLTSWYALARITQNQNPERVTSIHTDASNSGLT
jgi:hypothetical protein